MELGRDIWKTVLQNGITRWDCNDIFIEWLKSNINEGKTINNISKSLDMDFYALKRICDNNKIFIPINKFNNNFKAIYQDYNWCYEKYIIEGLNHDEMAKEANCTKRVIEKWCQEKHRLTQKYRQENKVLNDKQNDLIIGSLLGDGHIDKRETQPVFIVSHAENQKDYLYWKYGILKDLCNIEPTERQEEFREFNGKSYICQKSYRICTRIYDCLKEYRSYTYKELLERINETSLSIWILDDGYRGDSNWDLCVAEYSQFDIDFIISLLKDRYNLNCWQKKDKRYLIFDSVSSRLLDRIILKNIPNDLDIIKYKIIN